MATRFSQFKKLQTISTNILTINRQLVDDRGKTVKGGGPICLHLKQAITK